MLCLTSDLKGWIRQSMAVVLFKILARLKHPQDGKKLVKTDKFCLTGEGEEEGGKFQTPGEETCCGERKQQHLFMATTGREQTFLLCNGDYLDHD